MHLECLHPPLALAADGDGCELLFSLLYLCCLLGMLDLMHLPNGKEPIPTRSVTAC